MTGLVAICSGVRVLTSLDSKYNSNMPQAHCSNSMCTLTAGRNVNGAPAEACMPVYHKTHNLPTAPVQVSVDPSLMLMHVRCNKTHSIFPERPMHQPYQLTTMHVVQLADRQSDSVLCLTTIDLEVNCCGCSLSISSSNTQHNNVCCKTQACVRCLPQVSTNKYT